MWKSINLKEKHAKKSFQINSEINRKYSYVVMPEECHGRNLYVYSRK